VTLVSRIFDIGAAIPRTDRLRESH